MFHIKRSIAAAMELLLPPVCLSCSETMVAGQGGQAFCQACLGTLPGLAPGRCRRCAQSYSATTADHLCKTCLKAPPTFTTVYAMGPYAGHIKSLVHQLKYRNQLLVAKPLGELLAASIENSLDDFIPDAIIPVPLHIKRLRRRGYNQALEIARPIAKKLSTPLNTKLLQRVRYTPQQQGLSADDRRKNLRNAFTLTTPSEPGKVLLVDDVMTTGETVRECSRTLLAGGAEEVRVAVTGRA